eukprot:1138807-Pelagomonas_calceolata.AAC.12
MHSKEKVLPQACPLFQHLRPSDHHIQRPCHSALHITKSPFSQDHFHLAPLGSWSAHVFYDTMQENVPSQPMRRGGMPHVYPDSVGANMKGPSCSHFVQGCRWCAKGSTANNEVGGLREAPPMTGV